MKRISLLLVLIFLFTCIVAPTKASAYEISGFELAAETAMLYNLDTDSVIYSKNADEVRYPASLTKIMTAVVVLDNCEDLDKKVTVDSDDLTPLLGTGLTVAELKDGEALTIRQLLYLLLVRSAADASLVLAKEIGGSTDGFVAMMNEKAKELGLNNTAYTNPHGMHDDKHYTTAQDMLILAKYAINLPNFMDISNNARYTLPATNKTGERILATTNMLIDSSTVYYYKYAKSIKTGYTSQAGRCVISTASYNGYNYLCIIMGVENDPYNRREFKDSSNLYRWAFTNFKYCTLVTKDQILGEMPLELAAEQDFIQLYPEDDFSAIIPIDSDESSILTPVVQISDSVDAPVKAGEVMGYATIIHSGKEIGRVNVVARESVKRSTVEFVKRCFTDLISSLWFLVLLAIIAILLIIVIILKIEHNKRKRRQGKQLKTYRKF